MIGDPYRHDVEVTGDREAEQTEVLIAGAGVAGLEVMLALAELAPDRVRTTLLAPSGTFVYRPLLVAEPFGLRSKTEIDLAPIVKHAGAGHVHDSLASVDPGARTVTTASGSHLAYDALVVALGARPVDVVPGALTFGDEAQRGEFAGLLGKLGRRSLRRLAFVIPHRATWSLAAYELALLTAGERDARRLDEVELAVVTHEAAPLEIFGAAATQLVESRLDHAGIELHLGVRAERFTDGHLELAEGEAPEFDRAVALPGLEVPELAGLPQRKHGFIVTDARMQVSGLDHVWAAGDATSFPIKQGGLAAQQADVAARSIAARAGAHVPVQTFQPVLRAALITGDAPEYMRADMHGDAGEATVGQPLWWPSTKLAGNFLGPHLARLEEGGEPSDELVDLGTTSDPDGDRLEHDQALQLVLAAADADAADRDFEGALQWLTLAEQLDFVIPQAYITRRYEWAHQLDPAVEPGAAAGRIDPSLVDAHAAISDLQRRVGWLREIESRRVGQMRDGMAHFDRGMARLQALARKSGKPPRRAS